MSATLLRLGLWILVLVLALYVIHESSEQPVAELIPINMLQNALLLSVALIIGGVVMRMLEKGKDAVSKNRCRVCGTAVPQGAIYCRPHLRGMLEREDRRTHNTKIR
jgi:hypothetical protein